MIIDNVDDIETFFPSQRRKREEASDGSSTSMAAYLPQSCNGPILITPRNKDATARLAGGYKSIREVLVMDESQGLQLLWNKLRETSTEEGAVELLRALDCMPLAIVQAAAYINRRARMTILGFLKEFRANDKKKENLLNWDAGDLRGDESASNSVVMTRQISFERIRQERPSSADLLSPMSFFNPQGIPEWILPRHSRSVAKTSEEGEADSMFDEDFGTLQAYSLVAATAETDMCEMHALVKFYTQVWLSSFSDAERRKERFVGLMSQEFLTGQFENWEKCRLLLPHVESLYDIELSSRNSVQEWVQVFNNAGRYIETVQGSIMIPRG